MTTTKDPFANADEVQSGDLYKFDKDKDLGKVLIGVLKKRETRNFPKGEAPAYEIRAKEGMVTLIGSGDLKAKMAEVPLGSLVRIEYKELKKTTSGNDWKVFSVKSTENTEDNRAALGIEIFKEEAEMDAAEAEAEADAEALGFND
jgi:hypothetical protein